MDWTEIGIRAVKCGAWRWMPGMKIALGDRITERTIAIDHGVIPDLSDPATVGALLGLVRAVFNEPTLWIGVEDESIPPRWSWGDGGLAAPLCEVGVGWMEFDSEAEALVAALEHAP